ncbi:unnamed protein product [Phytophthora fragariaefolia]|uniref:Unnamed protein product n=1 Tax=Phytophthora fragariaefolia TaxID=1490495 RepID=A0A9W6Y567_9STRA|nr:unnamed protein product [Phytophthora fragariaefolia]
MVQRRREVTGSVGRRIDRAGCYLATLLVSNAFQFGFYRLGDRRSSAVVTGSRARWNQNKVKFSSLDEILLTMSASDAKDTTLDDVADQLEDLRIDVEEQLPPLPPVSTRPRGATWGSQAQMGDFRFWGGTFATPLVGTPGEDDVALSTVSSASRSPASPHEDQGRLTNAPSLPVAPQYSGNTLQDRRAFMRAYETYYRALCTFVTPYHRPFVMPISACIEERTGRMICLYEFKKSPNMVTEDKWIAHFKTPLRPDHHGCTAVDEAMAKLRGDTSLPDADSRMGKLRADMHKLLDKTNVEAAMLEKQQKKLVVFLVNGLGPGDFRRAAKTRLSYEENKRLCSDVVAFCGRALDLMRSHMLCQPSASDRPKKPQSRPAQQRLQGGHQRQQYPHSSSSSGGGPGEAARPIAECMQKGKENASTSRLAAVTKGSMSLSSSWDGKDKGTVIALVNTTLYLTVLLDSGADDSAVGLGLVQALAARGVPIDVMTADTPTLLCPVGYTKIQVIRQVSLDEIKIETSAGPQVVRGLKCWVREEGSGPTMIIGRPTMATLGDDNPTSLTKIQSLATTALRDEPEVVEEDEFDKMATSPEVKKHNQEEVVVVLRDALAEALAVVGLLSSLL